MAFGKILGGLAGWAFMGPVGGIIGVALGHVFEEVFRGDMSVEQPTSDYRKRFQSTQRPQTGSGDFAASLIVLTAAMMKADGKILKSELAYVKAFFNKQFTENQTVPTNLKTSFRTRHRCSSGLRANSLLHGS